MVLINIVAQSHLNAAIVVLFCLHICNLLMNGGPFLPFGEREIIGLTRAQKI